MRSSPDGMASSSSAQPPAAKGMSSIIFRRTQSGSTCCRSIVLSRGTAWTDSARSSTIPTRSTMRRGRRTGRRACSRSSRSAAATICGSTCRNSSARAPTTSARACWRTIGKRSRTCCSTRSRPSGHRGRDATDVRCATRRTDRLRASSTCMPRATCPRPRAPRFSGSSGRRPPRTSPDADSYLRRPQPGSASTFACGSPRSRRQSISSSSPA